MHSLIAPHTALLAYITEDEDTAGGRKGVDCSYQTSVLSKKLPPQAGLLRECVSDRVRHSIHTAILPWPSDNAVGGHCRSAPPGGEQTLSPDLTEQNQTNLFAYKFLDSILAHFSLFLVLFLLLSMEPRAS